MRQTRHITPLPRPLSVRVIRSEAKVQHSSQPRHPDADPPPPVGIDRLVPLEQDIPIESFRAAGPTKASLHLTLRRRFRPSATRRRGRMQGLRRQHLRRLVREIHRVHGRAVELE